MPKMNADEWEEEQVPRHKSQTDARAEHKDPRRCPVCSGPLAKTEEGGRYEQSCGQCRAVLATELVCTHCHTRRVWRGSLGTFCHGCGHSQNE